DSRVTLEVEVTFTEHLGAKWQSLRAKRLTERTQRIREVPDRWKDVAFGRQLDDAGESHLAMLVEMAHQGLERTGPDLCIRIQEQGVPSTCRLQRAVVGVGKTAVRTRNHASLRKLFCHEF